MLKKIRFQFLLMWIFAIALSQMVSPPLCAYDLPAFPGAEGYGARTTGGCGGRVIAVTNLNASGPGSLNDACQAKGPRIVVFQVAGTIDGDIRIKNDHITIAGQTAPGDGITIKGNLGIDVNDVVIRYLRVRTDHEGDALGGRNRKNIIVDHVSASWSSDEVFSLYHNENVTIQWCMITEACAKADGSHRFGEIWDNHYGTYHHNLIAHNDSRNLRWASGCGYNDYRNNVLYNWGYQSSYGGEAQQKGDRREPPIEFSTINMVANYYNPGPATRSNVKDCIASPSARGDGDYGSWHVAENDVDMCRSGFPEVTTDNWLGVKGKTFTKLMEPWEAMSIHQQPAQDPYGSVLEQAECSMPRRDSIDARIIEEVRTGTATHGNNGIITTPDDVGGWPKLQSAEAPQDSDGDGMPDDWEMKYGLDANHTDDNLSDIRSTNDYLDSAGKQLMADERSMVFRMSNGQLVLDFDITLFGKYGDIELQDRKDAGLNVRVPTSMSLTDGKGHIVNSVGDRDGDTWSKAANWVDYHGPVDGEHLGVAFLNHPSSFRHPTRWHVRDNGLFTANAFGQHSLDESAESGTFKLKEGEKVQLRHRIIFHEGDHEVANIAEAYKAYAASKPWLE